MKTTKEDFSFFEKTNPNLDKYVDRSFEISDRINQILKDKNITQKVLSEKLNKKESEISKWLTGVHNFTIKTISKLEVALGESIIIPVNGTEFNSIQNPEKISIDEDYIKIHSVTSYNKITIRDVKDNWEPKFIKQKLMKSAQGYSKRYPKTKWAAEPNTGYKLTVNERVSLNEKDLEISFDK